MEEQRDKDAHWWKATLGADKKLYSTLLKFVKGQEPKQFILSVLPDAIPHVGRPDPGPRVRKQISLLVQWLANLATAKRKDEKVDESASKEEDTNKFATAFKLVNFLLGKLSSFTKKK